jgi:predicted alpha-1,6-mannanase (GH76 family)
MNANWSCRTGYWTVALWILCSVPIANSKTAPSSDGAGNPYQQRATLAVNSLQPWYDEQTGLYRTTGWWNSANAITTLADYSRINDSKKFESIFSNTLSAAQKTSPGFINRFYDDEGWWALAWIDVYEVTHHKQYLSVAQSIFADMTGGWDSTCSGGIWWSKGRKYKNAIANELFLSVAAHLAVRSTGSQDHAEYLAWANREWQWFSRSGMINAEHLVNDGLDEKCANNHQTTWTYNQGVIIGALAELYRSNHDAALLSEARTIAAAALSAPALVDAQGILHEPCEPNCSGDGTQFKGIFVRNLSDLDEISPQPQYAKFIFANADSIWTGARSPDYHLGLIWAAPYGISNASTQSSAADALIAAEKIWKKTR